MFGDPGTFFGKVPGANIFEKGFQARIRGRVCKLYI